MISLVTKVPQWPSDVAPKSISSHIFCFIFKIFIYPFIFIFGCAGSALPCMGFPWLREPGLLCFKVREFLTVVASLVTEHRF